MARTWLVAARCSKSKLPVLLSPMLVALALAAAPSLAAVDEGDAASSERARVVLASALTATTAAPAPASGVSLTEAWAGLEAKDLDGRVWTAADLEGKVVLLEFWATWCAPCLADFPHLERAHAAYGERGLVILAVSLDRSTRRALRSFRRRQGMSWPVVFDGRGSANPVARRFGVEYPPRSLLFDRQGRLVALDARGLTLDAALRALFALE